MRIADKMQYNQVQANLAKNRSDMAELQNQAATQKRINKPSDDPLASARVLGSRTEERGSLQFIKNINNAKSFLEFSDQSLAELSETLVRAKELALSQASDASSSPETRQVTALEIEQIYNQVVQIGNRKLGERYIFGGTQTQNQPFNPYGEYRGNSDDMKVQIHKDSFVALNVPGSKIFMGKGLSGDGVARSSQSTPRTVEELQNYRDEERELQEVEKEKEEHYVQTRGPASYGRAERFKANDPVTNDLGINLFQLLKGLEVSLRTNDKDAVQASLDSLDQAISQVVLTRSEVGSRIMAINNTLDTIQKGVVDNKIAASQLEDADVFQVISDINKTDSALRATLETSGKMIQPSLLDFLK